MATEIWLIPIFVAGAIALGYWLFSRNRFVRVRAPATLSYEDIQTRYERSSEARSWGVRPRKYAGRLEGSWITVKYHNYCLKCSVLIEEGEKALWREGVGIWHGNCRKSRDRKVSVLREKDRKSDG